MTDVDGSPRILRSQCDGICEMLMVQGGSPSRGRFSPGRRSSSRLGLRASVTPDAISLRPDISASLPSGSGHQHSHNHVTTHQHHHHHHVHRQQQIYHVHTTTTLNTQSLLQQATTSKSASSSSSLFATMPPPTSTPTKRTAPGTPKRSAPDTPQRSNFLELIRSRSETERSEHSNTLREDLSIIESATPTPSTPRSSTVPELSGSTSSVLGMLPRRSARRSPSRLSPRKRNVRFHADVSSDSEESVEVARSDVSVAASASKESGITVSTLSFGLDHDPELDVDNQRIQMADGVRVAENTAVSHGSVWSTYYLFSVIRNPVPLVWWCFWSTLYRTSNTVALLDTWLLTRAASWVDDKRSYLVGLLPLLLILPFLYYELSSDHVPSFPAASLRGSTLASTSMFIVGTVADAASAVVGLVSGSMMLLLECLLALPAFIVASLGQVTYHHGPVESPAMPAYVDVNVGHDDGGHGETQPAAAAGKAVGRSDEEIAELVRLAVKREVDKIVTDFKAIASNTDHERVRIEQQQQSSAFDQVTVQFNHVLDQSKILHDELQSVKASLNVSDARSADDRSQSSARIDRLTRDVESLKTGFARLQLAVDQMRDTARNCCTNATDLAESTRRQFTVLLQDFFNSLANDKTGATETTRSFNEWMRSLFVTQTELTNALGHATDSMETKVIARANLSMEKILQVHLGSFESRLERVREEITRQRAEDASAFLPPTVRVNRTTAGGGVDGSLNELDVRRIVKDALRLYDADKTGMVDYALESSGGSVVSTRCSETYTLRNRYYKMFGVTWWSEPISPRAVIQPPIHPGECWAFKGSEGYIVIELSAWIRPSAFSVEHIPRELSPTGNIDSAPKMFSIWGLHNHTDTAGTNLGNFTYDATGEPLQYFVVPDPQPAAYKLVELKIHSNHGNWEYTCLYRFRVHGSRVLV